MTFGQQSGPPASARQVAYLLSLFNAAGFDFATARHQYGLTQRQSRGKFSVGEASEMIERLQAEADGEEPMSAPSSARAAAAQQVIDTQRATMLRGIPAETLADELQRRGWAVIPPS